MATAHLHINGHDYTLRGQYGDGLFQDLQDAVHRMLNDDGATVQQFEVDLGNGERSNFAVDGGRVVTAAVWLEPQPVAPQVY